MREKDLIQNIAAMFPRDKGQLNATFGSDAELLSLAAGTFAINVDSFSPDEDHFSSFDLGILGANLVVATMSDLYACGARPEKYLHACTLARGWDESQRHAFFQGIAASLHEHGAYLLGGDLGFSDQWSYTGVAIGSTSRAIQRCGAELGDSIYASGFFGAGNRQAFMLHALKAGAISASETNKTLATPRFRCRAQIAQLLAEYASFAIDSSDGFINSLADLAFANPERAFCATIAETIIDENSLAIAKEAGLPAQALLLGSGGEYELLFGVPERKRAAFESEATKRGLFVLRVGQVEAGSGVIVQADDRRIALVEPLPDPRSLELGDYIAALFAYIETTFSGDL